MTNFEIMKPSTNLPLGILIQFVAYCNSIREPVVLIVEGKRDIEALEAIGITLINGKILARKGLSLSKLADQIYPVSIIILLLDFDKEGKHMRSDLKKELQKRKGHGLIDPYPRQLLYKFFRAARINEIEEVKQFSSIIPKIEDTFKNTNTYHSK